MSIGAKIRELRESRNMSLDDVAKLCQTTRQTIYKYENGIVTNIPYDRIISLSKALNTTPAYLFGYESSEDENKISLDGLELTEGEIAFIRLLRRVPAEDKPVVIEKILSALDKQ
jgi:transcriptional regulator with XRE-family HTH domain